MDAGTSSPRTLSLSVQPSQKKNQKHFQSVFFKCAVCAMLDINFPSSSCGVFFLLKGIKKNPQCNIPNPGPHIKRGRCTLRLKSVLFSN